MPETIGGVVVPDSAVAAATELVRRTTPQLIYHHSRRAELDTFVNHVERAWGEKLLVYDGAAGPAATSDPLATTDFGGAHPSSSGRANRGRCGRCATSPK